MPMTRAEIVRRALAMTLPGIVTEYRLGAGGFRPNDPIPGKACDCSGFVAWCIGVSRKTDNPYYMKQNGGWFETSAVYRDATIATGFVEAVQRELAVPGDLLVFPDYERKQGHIGVVSQTDFSGPSRVVHCSLGAWKRLGNAISETSCAVFFRHNAITVRVSDTLLDGISVPRLTVI